MIRILGSLLLIGGATVIGVCASSELSTRARVLASFLPVLDIMRSEIGNCLTPVSELMEKLSQEAYAPLDKLFSECAKEKRERPDVPFSLIWAKSLSRAENLKLKSNEKEVLRELGSILGRYSAEEQVSAISHIMRRVGTLAESAAEDKKRLGKLYAKLGVICGVALVIVLI